MQLKQANLGINYASPVNWAWAGNQNLVSWHLALPGFMGGAKWRDLCSSADLSIGNHGTLTNIAQDSTSGWQGRNRPGGFGSLKLDGVNDYVPTTKAVTSSSGSFSVWLSFPVAPSANTVFFAQNAASDGNIGFGMQYVTTPKMSFFLNAITIGDGLAVGAGEIHHYAGTWKPNAGAKLYRDGVQTAASSPASLAPTVNATSGKVLQFGTFTYSGGNLFYANVFFDDFRIYSKALSDEEVLTLYRESAQGYPRGLKRIRPWYFKPPAGVTVALTGQSVSAAQGTLSVSEDLALTGQSAGSSQGSLGVTNSPTLVGQQADTGQGNLAASSFASIVGQDLTIDQGSLATTFTIGLTGQFLTTAQGVITAFIPGAIVLDSRLLSVGQGTILVGFRPAPTTTPGFAGVPLVTA